MPEWIDAHNRSAESIERISARNLLYQKALRILREQHQEEFRAIYDELRGLAPLEPKLAGAPRRKRKDAYAETEPESFRTDL